MIINESLLKNVEKKHIIKPVCTITVNCSRLIDIIKHLSLNVRLHTNVMYNDNYRKESWPSASFRTVWKTGVFSYIKYEVLT